MRVLSALSLFLLVGACAQADTAYWTLWESKTEGGMQGVITLPDSSTVTVTYQGVYFPDDSYLGPPTPNNGRWSVGAPGTFNSATVQNGPPNWGSVAIGNWAPGNPAHLLTFSRPVEGLVLAWDSVNVYPVVFQNPFTVLSSGCAFWGCGTFTMVQDGPSYVLTPTGEANGTILFNGTFSSFQMSDAAFERRREFTVGILGVASAPTGVPEPSAYGVLAFGAVAGLMARRKRG